MEIQFEDMLTADEYNSLIGNLSIDANISSLKSYIVSLLVIIMKMYIILKIKIHMLLNISKFQLVMSLAEIKFQQLQHLMIHLGYLIHS